MGTGPDAIGKYAEPSRNPKLIAHMTRVTLMILLNDRCKVTARIQSTRGQLYIFQYELESAFEEDGGSHLQEAKQKMQLDHNSPKSQKRRMCITVKRSIVLVQQQQSRISGKPINDV